MLAEVDRSGWRGTNAALLMLMLAILSRADSAAAQQSAAREGVHFIDMYPRFAVDGDRLDPRVTLDDLHLTGQGYTRWRQAIDECVRDEC